jgi:hypothetical protein
VTTRVDESIDRESCLLHVPVVSVSVSVPVALRPPSTRTSSVTMHAIQVCLFLRKYSHNSLTFTCHSNNIGPSETISVLYDLRLASLIYIREVNSCLQVLKESKFREHGRITPGMYMLVQPVCNFSYVTSYLEEFVAAGDFLAYKFPVWSW